MGTVQTPCAEMATMMDCGLSPPASLERPVLDCACHSQGCSPYHQSVALLHLVRLFFNQRSLCILEHLTKFTTCFSTGSVPSHSSIMRSNSSCSSQSSCESSKFLLLYCFSARFRFLRPTFCSCVSCLFCVCCTWLFHCLEFSGVFFS